jgi:multiple sugar transport system substrate-binding protein
MKFMARKGRRTVVSLGASVVLVTLAVGSESIASGAIAGAAPAGKFAGQTLTVLIPAPTTNVAAVNEFNSTVMALFQKQTGANLQYQTYTSASDELTSIETSAVSHSGPDVMNLGTTLVPTAYATHDFATLNASEWAQMGGQKAFFTQQLKMGGPNPRSYIGVPIDSVPFAMAYNTALFRKAGIKHAPTTWSEYVADAEKVNDPKKGIYGTGFDPADSYDPWKDYWTFALQQGGDFVSPNNKKSTLASPAVVNSVQFWFDWYTKFHIVNPQSLTWKGSDLVDAFAAGKVGEIPIQTINSVPTYLSGAIGHNFAFAPPPNVPYGMKAMPKGGQPASTIVSGQDDVVAKYANKALAVQYLKIATSPHVQQLQWKQLDELPVITSAAQAAVKSDPKLVGPFVKSLENADPTAFIGAWGPIESALAGATEEFATKVESSHQLPVGYIQSVLKSVDSQIQPQLS